MSGEGQKEFQWDATANRLWFEVDQDGEPVRCCIDALCLYLAFGASTLAEADATNAYISRRGWIHAAALNKAGKGDFECDGAPRPSFASRHATSRVASRVKGPPEKFHRLPTD